MIYLHVTFPCITVFFTQESGGSSLSHGLMEGWHVGSHACISPDTQSKSLDVPRSRRKGLVKG
jgi:hypothetical protein